jgi:hypothetical protein
MAGLGEAGCEDAGVAEAGIAEAGIEDAGSDEAGLAEAGFAETGDGPCGEAECGGTGGRGADGGWIRDRRGWDQVGGGWLACWPAYRSPVSGSASSSSYGVRFGYGSLAAGRCWGAGGWCLPDWPETGQLGSGALSAGGELTGPKKLIRCFVVPGSVSCSAPARRPRRPLPRRDSGGPPWWARSWCGCSSGRRSGGTEARAPYDRAGGLGGAEAGGPGGADAGWPDGETGGAGGLGGYGPAGGSGA